MAYRSVALYRWADHVDDDHIARLAETLDVLATQVPSVRAITHGRDAGTVDATFDYVVVIDVDTLDDWRTLRDHPSYILLIEELVTGHATEQAAGQFRVDAPTATPSPDDADLDDLTDDELMARARRAAQASMDALMAEPDDVI